MLCLFIFPFHCLFVCMYFCLSFCQSLLCPFVILYTLLTGFQPFILNFLLFVYFKLFAFPIFTFIYLYLPLFYFFIFPFPGCRMKIQVPQSSLIYAAILPAMILYSQKRKPLILSARSHVFCTMPDICAVLYGPSRTLPQY